MNSDSPATEAAHRWRPIEDLPQDWKRLGDRDLRHLAEFWNENRHEMAAHAAVRAFTERLGREWAIETGLIELGTDGDFWVTSSPDDDPDRRSYYGYQVVETAKAMRYFANTRTFHCWAALNLKTEGRYEMLVSIHGMGHEFAGLLVATACLATKERSGDVEEPGGTLVTKRPPARPE